MKDALLTRLRSLSERQLYDELYRDPLTQCLNRRAFEQLQPSPIAIIDLDSLKYLNDTLGHRYGDAFLVGLAVALVQEFGWDDVYRPTVRRRVPGGQWVCDQSTSATQGPAGHSAYLQLWGR